MAKSLEELLQIRKNQYVRVRKAQMTIAMIDTMVVREHSYLSQMKEMDEGNLATAFPNPEELGNHPEAKFN